MISVAPDKIVYVVLDRNFPQSQIILFFVIVPLCDFLKVTVELTVESFSFLYVKMTNFRKYVKFSRV